MSWRVLGDVSSMVGGIRALVVQGAHPEVVAGVADHSHYRDDPLGRLSRTSAYVTASTFGAGPEVEQAVAVVRAAHRVVHGRSHRGRPYSATDQALAAWVHNVLTDSFLSAYRHFGPQRLTRSEADQFVLEQSRLGRMLDAHPLPETAETLANWIRDHPDLGPSPGMVEAMRFLGRPSGLGPGQAIGYRILFAAAVATLPARLTQLLGAEPRPQAEIAGRNLVRALRWALGSSPSWHLALIRMGAAVPPGLFRQPLPIDTEVGATGRRK